MTNATITISDVTSAILRGDLDDQLDTIQAAYSARRKARAQIMSATLTAGMKVRLGGVRPLYLEGAPATIVDQPRPGRRFNVRLDQDWLDENPQAHHRFFRGLLKVSADMIEIAP